MAFQVDKGKIAKNTIALYLRLGFTMVISFFTARVTLEQLGVEDYGLNNLVGSVVSMLTFLNGSMGTAVQRYFSIEIGKDNESNLKKVFGVGLSLHIIVAIFTFIVAEIFAVFFLSKMNIPDSRMWAAQMVFQISVVSLILNILNVPHAALLRAREMFTKMASIEIAIAILRLLVLYLLVTISYDKLITLSFLNLGVTVAYIGSLTWLAYKFDESRTKPLWDSILVKKMLDFISMLVITVLAQLAKVQGLIFLINLFFGLTINAAYAIAVQVSNIVNGFITNFKLAVVPQMMSSYGAGDLKTMHRIINTGTKMTFLLLITLSLPVIFESNFLLILWLKTPPQYSPELVSLVLIYINVQSFTYFHYQGVHATGHIRKQQIFVSILYMVNIVLVWASFKIGFSFYSALYINMIISMGQCIVNIVYAHKLYNYDLNNFLRTLLFPSILLICITSCILLVITNMLQYGYLRFFVVGIVSTLLSLGGGYFLLLDSLERQKVKQFVFKHH